MMGRENDGAEWLIDEAMEWQWRVSSHPLPPFFISPSHHFAG